MPVTRIKNNQITDNTIEFQKIKDGTLVGAKFNSNLTLNSNISIIGNLTVTGNTTTVNSINTVVNDPLIVFNNGYSGVPSYDVGIIVDRDLAALGGYGNFNTAWVWSEADDAFIGVLTTETGETIGQINRSFFANVKVGNVLATTGNLGSLLVGQTIASGNIVAASGTNASSFTTGAIVVSGGGGVGITGALYVQGQSTFEGNINAGNIVLSGNINVPVGGTFSNTGVFYGNAGGIGALYAGTPVYTGLPHTVLQMTGNVDTYAQVNFQNYNSGTKASTDFVATADNGDDNDGYINLGINSSTFNDPAFPYLQANDGYLIHHGVGNTGNLFIINHTGGPGNGMAFAVGGFDTGNVKAIINTGGMVILANTQSVDQQTGALQIYGGMSVQGNIHAVAINQTPIGNTNPSTGSFTDLNSTNFVTTNFSTANILISGGSITGVSGGASTFVVTNLSSGNAVISGGYITGVANIATTGVATIAGNLVAASSQSSTSTTTGALVVVGGAGIGGNVNVGEDLFVTGNLTVQGTTTTLNTNVLDVEDKNITIAKGAVNAAAADQGGITLEGANATILYASTGDSWNFNKQVIAPTLNITANVFLKPQLGGATVAIDPLVIGTIDNMSIGSSLAANVVATNMRATTSLFAAPSGTIWLRGGTGTNGINNIPIGVVTPAAGYFTFANVSTLNVNNTAGITTLSSTTGEIANFSSANVLIAAGVIYNVNIQANNISTANALITALETTTGVVTNFSTGNAQITGGTVSGLSGGTASNAANSGQTLRITSGGLGATGDSYFDGDLGIAESLRVEQVSLLNGNVLANSRVTTNYTAAAGTASTGGALVIPGTGGAAVGGNLYVGQGTVINGSQSTHDTIIRGVNERALVYAVADSTYDQVTIGGNLVAANVPQGAKLTVNSNDAMIVPVGTSAQRPGSQGYTDIAGMVRFNSTVTSLEFYDGSSWQGVGSSFTVINSTVFSLQTGNPSGNVDGINANFALPVTASTNGTIISINGVVQLPTTAYSIAGNLITFTEPPAVGDVIDVRALTTTTQVTTLASDNGFNQIIVDNNAVQFWTGTAGTGTVERWNIETDGDLVPATTANIGSGTNRVNYLFASNINLSGGTITGVALTGGPIDDTPIGGNIGNTGNFTTLTANVFQANTSVTIIAGLMTIDNTANTSIVGGTTGIIDSFDKTVHRSGKFFVQVSNESTGEYQATEVICVHDGTTPQVATYGVTFTGAANLAVFSANIAGNDVNLNATPVGNVNIKTFATLMKI